MTFDGATPVSDPTALAVSTATAAHADYAKLVKNFNAHGMNPTVMAITRRALNRGANGLADMIITLGQSAPPPASAPRPPLTERDAHPLGERLGLRFRAGAVRERHGLWQSCGPERRAAQRRGDDLHLAFQDDHAGGERDERLGRRWECMRGIGRATVGYTVRIDVSASWSGQHASTSTSFTPR